MTAADASESGRLVRGLGLIDATTLIVGSVIGSGIFVAPSIMAGYVERSRPQVPRAGAAGGVRQAGLRQDQQTDGLKPPPFAGEPEDVARVVLKAIERGTPVVYAPPMWALVMLVIRHLPRFVMRRIGF